MAVHFGNLGTLSRRCQRSRVTFWRAQVIGKAETEHDGCRRGAPDDKSSSASAQHGECGGLRRQNSSEGRSHVVHWDDGKSTCLTF
jgi:hypothetical protein